MYAIGIDMSKRSFHAAFDEEMVREFANTDQGVNTFLEELLKRERSPTDTAIGIEATGAYHLLFCIKLSEAGWQVRVINPLESSRMIRMQSLRNVKTDRTDARAIRKAVLLGLGYPFTDTRTILALKALLVERQGLVLLSTMLKHQQEAHRTTPDAVGALHDSATPVLKAIRTEVRDIEKRMRTHEPDVQALLRSIPGIGVLSAAVLVAFVGDIRRFTTPDKLVAYIGLDSRVYESGTSVRGKGRISKRGNKYLRHTLFNAAFIARQHHPGLKGYFEKKIGEGKHYFSAMCAVEHKLVRLIWAVWTRGTPFESRS
jgi:transposase